MRVHVLLSTALHCNAIAVTPGQNLLTLGSILAILCPLL